MRRMSRATAPGLAGATGLSLVTVHKALRHLCRQGELRRTAERSIRGGRPAYVYEYEAQYARQVRLSIKHSGGLIRTELEQADLQGRRLSYRQSTYASLEQESLDGLLDTELHGRRIAGIELSFTPARTAREDLRTHLQQRYGCPVTCANPATALADEREGCATLYLSRRQAPQCCIRRGGNLLSAGRLDLLPLPCSWEELNYDDHTMVEEMVARLLHILTCTLAPQSIDLHADFWTARLIERIRFNTQTKLRDYPAPKLAFHHLPPAAGD